MIPRIVHPRLRRADKFAFGRGKATRSLRVFVDGETMSDSPELDVLLAFAHHPEVELFGTDERFKNVVRIGVYDTQGYYTPWDIEYADGRRTFSGVAGPDIPAIGRRYADDGREERAERSIIFAHGAGDHGSDALATADPLLLERFPRSWVEAGNPMPIEQAVALLGLFLRVREDFTIELGEGVTYSFDRGLFYWVLMRDLTPNGWRWFSACVGNSSHTRDDALLFLAQSALERIERALRARDRLHEKLQLPPSRDAATEAIFYFDVALLMLGGAFDGLARVAHVVHGIVGSERAVGWGNRSWMKRLGQVNRPLAEMMAKGEPHRDARELVAILRNTIHQEAFRTVSWQTGGTRSERIMVPASIKADLEKTLGRLGDAADYGVSQVRGGTLYIEPGVYLEKILQPVFGAVNAIMDATPVENLPGVEATNLPTGPPEDETFNAATRERVRLLGGIG